MIEHFPDHMHEGGVFEDDEVRLNDPLDIPGYERDEYPMVRPVVATAAAAAGAPRDVWSSATATGDRVRADHPSVCPTALSDDQCLRRRSGPVGRVVVDSTWHHWFSMNLVGLRNLSPGYYAGMQDYYRNVALWLATPQQRALMLFAATWGALVGSQPGAFDAVLGIRRLGERVVDVIGQTAPQCILDELVATTAMLPSPAPRKSHDDRLWIWAPSRSAFNTLIVGGIAIRMLEQAHHHINEQAHGRESELDADAVRRLGLEGVATATRELLDALDEGSERLRELRDQLTEQESPTPR